MELAIETKGEETTVTLPEQFQDQTVEAFRQAALDCDGPKLVILAGAVEKIGAAGAQVLLAARRHLEQRGATMLVMDSSPALEGAMGAMGLESELRGMKG